MSREQKLECHRELEEEEEEAEEKEEEEWQAARAGRSRPVTARTPGWQELPLCCPDSSAAVNNCQNVK